MRVLFFEFVETEIFFQVSYTSLRTPPKIQGLCVSVLWVCGCGRGWVGDSLIPLCQPPSVLREVPDCVGGVAWGWWDGAPTRLRAAVPSRAGWGNSTREALPSPPPGPRGGSGGLSNWRVFQVFVFAVINPSKRAPSVALGREWGWG